MDVCNKLQNLHLKLRFQCILIILWVYKILGDKTYKINTAIIK